jgi:hypothetical protein
MIERSVGDYLQDILEKIESCKRLLLHGYAKVDIFFILLLV